MSKFFVISFILLLILFTAFIKNSTKKIDEEIFAKEENLRFLRQEFGSSKLEFEYLSSTEKLIKFQKSYFDDELLQRNLEDIKIIDNSFNILSIKETKKNNDW